MSEPNTVSVSTAEKPSWQRHMRDAIRTVDELCDHLGLDAAEHASLDASSSFSVFAPRPFVSRMQHGDATDPLLLQVLPVAAEMRQVEGYVVDPLSEQQVSREPGSAPEIRPSSIARDHGRVCNPLPILFSPPLPVR